MVDTKVKTKDGKRYWINGLFKVRVYNLKIVKDENVDKK